MFCVAAYKCDSYESIINAHYDLFIFFPWQLLSKAEKMIMAQAKEANKHIRFQDDWLNSAETTNEIQGP